VEKKVKKKKKLIMSTSPEAIFRLNVILCIKPDRREEFLTCILNNQKGTLSTEPLALSYIFGEDTEIPNTFHFVESYKGREGFEAHQITPHFAVWEKFAGSDPFTSPPIIHFFTEHVQIYSSNNNTHPNAQGAQSILFRPCIDIHDGVVKQIVGGTLTGSSGSSSSDDLAETNFVSTHSAAYYAQLYKERQLRGGHVIMLGRSKGTEEQALSALAAYPNGLQIGGGITPSNAQSYLDAGATHVIVTSYVFRDGRIDQDRLEEMVNTVGKDRLVLDLSCRWREFDNAPEKNGYYVVTDRWQKFTNFQITPDSVRSLETKCDEFLVHGVDVEGLRCGIQEDLVSMLSQMCSIPVTYAGGARSLDDLRLVRKLGHGKVALTIGSALDIFGGELKMEDVLLFCQGE
jgi:phosphoribosylformimino-5-aminoimidazole carboxamide ribotide isomerase